MQVALDEGFEMFKGFCLREGKQTSICHFDMKKTLKIETSLGTRGREPKAIMQLGATVCSYRPSS